MPKRPIWLKAYCLLVAILARFVAQRISAVVFKVLLAQLAVAHLAVPCPGCGSPQLWLAMMKPCSLFCHLPACKEKVDSVLFRFLTDACSGSERSGRKSAQRYLRAECHKFSEDLHARLQSFSRPNVMYRVRVQRNRRPQFLIIAGI